jgi:hypothetical protein
LTTAKALFREFLAASLNGRPFHLLSPPEDFEAFFLKQVTEHGLAALIWDTLSGTSISQQFHEDARFELARLADFQRQREYRNRQALLEVSQSFEKSNLDMILVGASAVAYSLYPSPHMRARKRNELFVRSSDLPQILDVMSGLNYICVQSGHDLLRFDGQAPGDPKFEIRSICRDKLFVGDAFTFDEVWATTSECETLGIRRPSDFYSLLLICLRNHFSHPDLLRIYDVHLLASQKSHNWIKEFARLADQKGFGPICSKALDEAHYWFETPLPSPIQMDSRPQPFNKNLTAWLTLCRRQFQNWYYS